ncbi:MAG: DEAD/DEAH box helicase [Myxococcales bacterium]|nr:DEAD/DEAH box helicase [Myxococcales bacterium]MCB9534177.1 DEAD/DEAH box helicase [Myxococcales bacterium]
MWGAAAVFGSPTASWLEDTFAAPTPPQRDAWPAIKRRHDTLIAAPTGSGKTLAAFLAALDDLADRSVAGTLENQTYVVYVSPLKALSNDIEKNLQAPLAGIMERVRRDAPDAAPITVAVRTGDTSAKDRRAAVARPPHVLVTTPESLYILLTSRSGRAALATTCTVIVDEIHALVGDKRGSHLALSLERLEALVVGQGNARPQRVGLSATQRPIEDVASFLVGARDSGCVIVDSGHRRQLDLEIEVPPSPLEAVMSAEAWTEIHARLVELIEAHKSTIVFVNTRRLAERLTAALEERLGADAVMAHHGSLSRQHRLLAEQRLARGELRALVATASLELGIDVGDVDLVCQISTTRSISALLQRVGRAGHGVGLVPKGRLFPLSRDELVEAAATLDAIRRGELDLLRTPVAPLDILAQQVVAAVGAEEWGEDDLFERVRLAWPYKDLPRKRFDEVVEMLAEGFSTRRGRRAAYLHRDAVNRRLRARRGAAITAMTSGGAIPDLAAYDVVLEATGTRIGSLDEDFAIESMVGDVFRLGTNSWQILKVEPGRVVVRDAAGMQPTIPFWFGEAPPRTDELSAAVSRLRGDVDAALARGGVQAAREWLRDEVNVPDAGAVLLAEYLAAARAQLGAMPTRETVVLERFFDESGGMQLVIHAPFGVRINRAWGLALRKRFCRRFNFELQAAATEDAIVLSLGVTHSFVLEEVFDYLSSGSVRGVLVQALLDAPMFGTRWRWNANRALAVPRFRSGRKVPAALQRMNAEDLVAVVFPDQLACFENIAGEREVPDHPLVDQTLDDCLTEAMDLAGLISLLEGLCDGTVRRVAVDVAEPSVLAAEILNASPYAFLDDAPLEERRTQAVRGRRWVAPDDVAALGALDPAAVESVRADAWPRVRDADELHDALVVVGTLAPDLERDGDDSTLLRVAWGAWIRELVDAGRAVEVEHAGVRRWVAVERLCEARAAWGDPLIGGVDAVPNQLVRQVEPETAARELVRGRLEVSGPIAEAALVSLTGLDAASVSAAALSLESEGFAMRGRYSGGLELEWCERRLLARVHRQTLDRLRERIQPVSPAALVRHLGRRMRLLESERAEGIEGLMGVITQLRGFAAPVAAWEGDILPSRVRGYTPALLDILCLSGRVAWCRAARTDGARPSAPVKSTPVLLLPRSDLGAWADVAADATARTGAAARVLDALSTRGASFFGDLCAATGLLGAELERALSELVSAGLVVSDGFAGLRALVAGSGGRASRDRELAAAGRWTLAPVRSVDDADGLGALYAIEPRTPDVVSALLDRYGVVFRSLLARETGLPPWRDLLRVLRRMEARGEVRGGRFVDGFAGEQYASADTIAALRAARDVGASPEIASVCGADPLNLSGSVLRGDKVAAVYTNRVLLRDGELAAWLEGGRAHVAASVPSAEAWELEKRLVRAPSVARRPPLAGRHASAR